LRYGEPLPAIMQVGRCLILPGFRGHPEASFELEVFDGRAGSENQAAFLYGGLQAPSRRLGG
jgi:hypothetical protein